MVCGQSPNPCATHRRAACCARPEGGGHRPIPFGSDPGGYPGVPGRNSGGRGRPPDHRGIPAHPAGGRSLGRGAGPRVDRGRAVVNRGEVWWAEHPEAGRRPYLILTRQGAIPVLSRILAVPATRTMRGIPTEVVLDEDDGMPGRSALSFDNVVTMPKSLF